MVPRGWYVEEASRRMKQTEPRARRGAPEPATGDAARSGEGSPSIRDLPPPPEGRAGWPWTEESPRLPERRSDGSAWPRISVVTPSFNQGHYIEETIRSVLLQGYPKLELLVVDGGSRDETVEILRRYEPWLTYWVSEPDRGQTHAINKGLERVTGELFGYLNSDDVLSRGALAAVAEGFRQYPEADVLYGRCVYTDEAGADLFSVQAEVTDFLSYLRIWDRLWQRSFLTQPEVFCRTEAVRQGGGFREDLHSVMDLEMWLRLLARGCRFQPVDAPVARFRTYAAQKSAVDPGTELCQVVREYIDGGPGLSDGARASLRRELRVVRAHLLVRGAIAAALRGRYGTAVRYNLRAVRSDPGIAATYPFWAVLAHPLKRWVSPRRRARIRGLLGLSSA
jgi:glycosyltransferase involved in cell wall biosynthesis